ncbi:Undecaprenyl-phosphate galactosephosphotransferase [Rhodovulum sp. P5]|uniref:sugar transferase n=1 Tax=Rhodovulum sp. P5 TaxID=1564506 RepID=UPI0009C341C6|nr:sugar transferase [Rhodovulum sp. P5]ARE40420.1 Undecaprenyl-phosphate galactosephosphotransferase [Rhodovulum sp. P5]
MTACPLPRPTIQPHHVGPAAEAPPLYRGKRSLDCVLALVLLPLALPIVATLWAHARLRSGPGFVAVRYVGQGGREFSGLEIAASAGCTPVSHPARRWTEGARVAARFRSPTGLSALPLLLNVLRGEMSLVGPQPVTRAELARYGLARGAYLGQRPGLTGPWQIFGHDRDAFGERIDFDLRYSCGASLWGDLILLAHALGRQARVG